MDNKSEEFTSRVLITIKNGLIEEVEKDPMVKVEIRDYDVDFVDEEDLFYDENGTPYIERVNE